MKNHSSERASAALRRHGLRPRKRLGQNFLRDRSFLKQILDAAELRAGDLVLELGAGTGVLTRALAAQARRVIAVELDDSLYDLLQAEFADVPNLELWHGNALDFDPCNRLAGPYKVVGNIPYYVTGPITRHFLETPCPPQLLVLMVQREVADRIVAAPGELSLLGVSVQFYARPRIVARVPAGAFYPRPKVDSALIRLVPHHLSASPEETDRFFEVARAGFSTRRKQLVNALSAGLKIGRDTARNLLQMAHIDETRRAETLSLDEWRRLAQAWRQRAPLAEQ